MRSRKTVLTRAAAVLTATVLGAGLGASCADGATPAALPAGTTFTVTGHGWGHGHGMSQYGARGAATRGLTYAQIMSFYYPGTTWGRATGRVSVLITENKSRRVVVQARTGLFAHTVGASRTWNLSKLRPRAARWRVVPLSGGRSRLDFLLRGWHAFRTVPRDLEFHARGNAPIRLFLPGGSRQYRGILRSASPVRGRIDRDAVNILPLDAYLKGVVPQEMPASWPAQAVRAQAVAARSYAAYERAAAPRRHYQICDTSACQVYGGFSAEQAASNAAVSATAGRIRTYGGKPAFTQFSSSNGGYMLAGSQPYLVSKKDPYEQYSSNPNATWTKTLTLKQVQNRWPSAGDIEDVSFTTYGNGNPWVKTVTVQGSNHTYTISGDGFRSWAGLRSSNFTMLTSQPATKKSS